MSWDILTDTSGRRPISALYCNTSDVVFGPVMYDTDRQEAEDFVELLDEDPRGVDADELSAAWDNWQTAKEAEQVNNEL